MCSERFDKSDDQILYMVSIEVLTDVWLYNFSIAILGTVRKTVGQVVFQALDAIGECCVFADDRCRVKLETKQWVIEVLFPSARAVSRAKTGVVEDVRMVVVDGCDPLKCVADELGALLSWDGRRDLRYS